MASCSASLASKSARRRCRTRRTAVLKSRHYTASLIAAFNLCDEAPAEREAVGSSSGHKALSVEADSQKAVADRLCNIEKLLHQLLQGYNWGPCSNSACHGTFLEDSGDVDGNVVLQQLAPAANSWNTNAPAYTPIAVQAETVASPIDQGGDALVPATPMSQDQCVKSNKSCVNWGAVPILDVENERERNAAAVTIQSIFRGYMVRKDILASEEDSEEKNEYDERCARCGELFIIPTPENGDGEYDGDRCDICGSPHHPECLRDYIDLHGAWSLCCTCALQRAHDPRSVTGDFRMTLASFWQPLYAKFSTQCAERKPCPDAGKPVDVASCIGNTASNTGNESEALEHNSDQAARHEQPDSGTSGNVGKGMCELDNLLEYLIRFLEGEHMKSASISQASRGTILARVKAALEWKRHDRTAAEAAAMVEDLNNMMFRILQQS